jgi:hypothetical protein
MFLVVLGYTLAANATPQGGSVIATSALLLLSAVTLFAFCKHQTFISAAPTTKHWLSASHDTTTRTHSQMLWERRSTSSAQLENMKISCKSMQELHGCSCRALENRRQQQREHEREDLQFFIQLVTV